MRSVYILRNFFSYTRLLFNYVSWYIFFSSSDFYLNLLMLFHLFRKYPDKRFVIIADYKKEVMREYLDVFADVKYNIVDASGTGTCAGVNQAVGLIPEHEPFLLVWSDLILPADLRLPDGYEDDTGMPSDNYIGLSQTFSCRWKYENGELLEEESIEFGVAGFFLFREKSEMADVPNSGEFVRWMQQKQMRMAGKSILW